MYKKKRILGLIPARGGSKGLPGKNILPLAGKPLIAWSIEAGLKSKLIDRVVVTTDDKKIAAIARKYGAEVPFLRPLELAKDNTSSVDTVLHALNWLEKNGDKHDYVILLEPTSPLRETKDVDRAIRMLVNNKVAESIMGVCRIEAAHPRFAVKIDEKGLIVPFRKEFSGWRRRQDIEELYFFEGTVYASKIETLRRKKIFYHDKTIPYIVPRWKSLEIDEILDLICAEAIMKNIERIKEK